MITVSLTVLHFYTCVFVIWLIDSFLNSKLAKRIGDEKRLIYFIPIISYYRFGVLTGVHCAIVGIGVVTTVVATLWFGTAIPLGITIISTLLSIIVNSIIISFAANRLMKSKWIYACSSIVFGIIGICAEPIIIMTILKSSSYAMIFLLLSLQAILVQVPKIMLIMTTIKTSSVQNGTDIGEMNVK